MSKENAAKAAAAAAAALSAPERVEELAQALLREFMHKKKYYKTLQQFDTEKPRTEKTIGSRSVMNDLMALTSVRERLTHSDDCEVDVKAATIMEVLCAQRLGKRSLAHEIEQILDEQAKEAFLEEVSDSSVELARLEDEVKKKKKKLKKVKKETLELKEKLEKEKENQSSNSEKKKSKKSSAVPSSNDFQELLLGRGSSNTSTADSAPSRGNQIRGSGDVRNALDAGLELMSTAPVSSSQKEARTQVGRHWMPGDGAFSFEAIDKHVEEEAARLADVRPTSFFTGETTNTGKDKVAGLTRAQLRGESSSDDEQPPPPPLARENPRSSDSVLKQTAVSASATNGTKKQKRSVTFGAEHVVSFNT
eukprot:PhM_4_TR15565/c0_g1_i1/m.98406